MGAPSSAPNATATSATAAGSTRNATAYQPGCTRQRKIRRTRSRTPARPSAAAVTRSAGTSWAKTTVASRKGSGAHPASAGGVSSANATTSIATIIEGTGWRATSVRTDPVGVAVRVMTATLGGPRAAGHPASRPIVEGVDHTPRR